MVLILMVRWNFSLSPHPHHHKLGVGGQERRSTFILWRISLVKSFHCGSLWWCINGGEWIFSEEEEGIKKERERERERSRKEATESLNSVVMGAGCRLQAAAASLRSVIYSHPPICISPNPVCSLRKILRILADNSGGGSTWSMA